MEHFSTLTDLIAFQDKKFSNDTALNFKKNGEWKHFSNDKFLTQAFHFACGLKEMGLEKGQTVAIASHQNPIWLIVDFGSLLAGAVTVPIFHNISTQNLLYEIEDAQVTYFFTDDPELLAIEKEKKLNLKNIIDGFTDKHATRLKDVLSIGREAAAEGKYELTSFLQACEADDLATIIYTSGSTGLPKGVELTHSNLVSQIKDTADIFSLSGQEVALSFLPLAHIFERMVMMFYISQGVSVYFANDVTDVGDLLKEVKPHIMTSVPRVLEKVYGRIKEKVDEAAGVTGYLAKKAVQRALLKHPDDRNNMADIIYDRMIYRKLRGSLGGNMDMIICGGAALSPDMERFFKNIGINLYCGYGLTEASPVISVNGPQASKFGTVGKIFPSVEVKLGENSELLVAGPNIMRGYHNQEEQTQAVMDGKWLKTGDLAQLDDEGFLTIIGRKKELFKNANGKYVSPVPIEQKLMQDISFLLGAVIIAESRKFTSVLLFPDFETLPKTKEKFTFLGSDEAFLESDLVKEFVQKQINQINETLDNWEKIRKFVMIKDQISIETGEITPSMKLKRKLLEDKYKEVIDGFYGE